MSQRFLPFKSAAAATKAMMAVEKAVDESGLEHSLLELVKLRASQINGCAFCVHMHAAEARKSGESEMRLYLLNAWRESPLYSDRERVALAWTETLTLIAERGAPDNIYARLKEEFTETEQANLTMAIGAINLWTRLQIGAGASHPISSQ
ncbi:carboxymuconolactone decarboxylase family protein [Roseovarius mucosus]|uniref:carboxymuconolactone decarboxylase family protein n=1 Tax=Roseovarius mucosus TaxID=215743 RepID=UPI001C5FB20E|nr:carboxymuconolactone decarboxylase family protein [Roseovarius mucosus]MBW4976208.1 carboxymuconolactone decarboxylase family protein [Roseovarius mucosus]